MNVTLASYYDPYIMDLDPSGYYFLISPRFDIGRIEVEVKDDVAKTVALIHGNRCQDIWNEVFKHREWVTTLDHAAYLGKEIKKAEIALVLGVKDYYQE